jgi:protein phosphatase PTC1
LTHDHKPESCPEDVERLKSLTPPGFIDANGRVNGYIAITRAMGDHNMKRPGYIHNTPHISIRTLTEANDYLILACDGVGMRNFRP